MHWTVTGVTCECMARAAARRDDLRVVRSGVEARGAVGDRTEPVPPRGGVRSRPGGAGRGSGLAPGAARAEFQRVAPPAQLRRHFLPWNRPLPAQAAAWLARGWTGPGPLDLGGVLVIVPTRQSGRRLREALAEHAAARGSGVFAPRVGLPEDLLIPPDGGAVASPMETRLAWTAVLLETDLEEFRAVFPVDPPVRNFAWASRLAGRLQRLQTALGENGLRLGDVPARAGVGLPETERWEQLGELERRVDAALAALGRHDPQAARVALARVATPPDGVQRIVLLATPDPLPQAVAVLEEFARTRPVDVVVSGPEEGEGAALFDEWGRPRVEVWKKRPLSLTDFDSQVHLCADAAAQAARVTALARDYGNPEGFLAVGVADPEVAPVLEGALREAGQAVFNPEGRPRRQDGLRTLLASLAALVHEPAFETVQQLARCPDFISWLEERAKGGGFSPAAMLAGLDDLNARHLPATLEAAQPHTARRPAAAAALAAAAELRRTLTQGEFPANAVAALGMIMGGRRPAGDPVLAGSADAWMKILREADAARAGFPGVPDADWWELALAQFDGSRRFDERPTGAVELNGWLELLWEDAPHLVVTGLNDGRAPEAVAGDAFLPEALRVRLGLKTNEARFARDAYMLAAMAAARTPAGRLDLLVGQVSAAGDPLRPSRLLLACEETALPRRVAALFRPAEAAQRGPSWRRAWKLVPPVVAPPARVSVTAFRDYLRCPFRFYLKHALRMETVDPHKTEMDALDFGTLCHVALEALGREAALRDCADPAVLREFLLERLDRLARDRYGAELSLPLLVQIESARQRLARAAAAQAEQRAAGWVIGQVERKFELPVGAVIVSGKIDRVERNEGTGAVRVLDYKTSDRAVAPQAAHVRAARRDGAEPPEWARFRMGGKEMVWVDLQLPLYLAALAEEAGGAVEAGYFNLPKAVGETAVTAWDGYDADWRAAARRCAEGVAAAVTAGIFWPPAETPPREEDGTFAGLFHHGAAGSVDWRGAR